MHDVDASHNETFRLELLLRSVRAPFAFIWAAFHFHMSMSLIKVIHAIYRVVEKSSNGFGNFTYDSMNRLGLP